MTDQPLPSEIGERTIELIAERVAALLREELEAIAAEFGANGAADRPLTVEEVAARFGIARSTVYAHWQEWGGYKLGEGEKASIRFAPASLPEPGGKGGQTRQPSKSRAMRRERKAVLRGAPRLPSEFEAGG